MAAKSFKNGSMTLNGRTIDLKILTVPCWSGLGKPIRLLPEQSAKPLMELTSSTDKTFTLIPGGHLGLMSNQKTANTFWPKLTTWLAQRSTRIDA